MKQLLAKIPRDRLNQGDPPTCTAVERLVECYVITPVPGFEQYNEERRRETLACLEILLHAGAQWQPDIARTKSIRRTLLKHPSHFISGVLRLLIHTPGATTPILINELCNSPVIRAKVADWNKPLLKETDAIREKLGEQQS